MTTDQTTEQGKKRKRLTLEEQIARQQELLEKDRESLAKKQKRLRSLNASKMNKDRIQSQKKRNSMLIQLGLFFIQIINWQDDEEEKDAKLDMINYYIENIEEKINEDEANFNNKYSNNRNTKEAKIAMKSIYDKYTLLNAFKNMKENYLRNGKVEIYI